MQNHLFHFTWFSMFVGFLGSLSYVRPSVCTSWWHLRYCYRLATGLMVIRFWHIPPSSQPQTQLTYHADITQRVSEIISLHFPYALRVMSPESSNCDISRWVTPYNIVLTFYFILLPWNNSTVIGMPCPLDRCTQIESWFETISLTCQSKHTHNRSTTLHKEEHLRFFSEAIVYKRITL